MPVENMEEFYSSCTQCPRNCGANRISGNCGFCKESYSLKAASACLHFGEEPLVTVFGGSGTIFITGCTLRCTFCQNYQISQNGMGRELNEKEFVDICLKLQQAGAENINIVTGSHHIPVLSAYLKSAKKNGLTIPVCWNSSAYESVEMLELLRDVVDIYLPDLKTLNPLISEKLFGAKDYPQVAKKAIRWMLSAAPLKIENVSRNGEEREKIFSGTIIRHLFLPGRMNDTILTLDWLKEKADGKACISLMSQYTPIPFKCSQQELEHRNEKLSCFQNRLVNSQEDAELRKLIDEYEFEYLFYQDLSEDTDWLPDFENEQPFPNKLAQPIWHWKHPLSKN